jgi:hypothetical protein
MKNLKIQVSYEKIENFMNFELKYIFIVFVVVLILTSFNLNKSSNKCIYYGYWLIKCSKCLLVCLK